MTLRIEEVENCKDLADSYLDIQKTRVAMGLRIFQMENKALMKVDLCEKITVNEPKKEDEQQEDEVIDEKTGEIKELEQPTDLVTVVEEEDEEHPIVKQKKIGYKYVRANAPVEKELKPLRKLLRRFKALMEKGEKVNGTEFKEWYESVPEEYRQGEERYAKTYTFLEMLAEGLETKLKTIREKIKLALEELAANSETFKRFKARFDELEKIENEILKDAEAVFGETELWKYFQSVKGLGPVAALTMLGNVDVFKSPTVGHAWSNIGLIPGKTLKRGQSSNFNPKVRARILGVICNNIIRLGDPYYTGIYAIKKAYHQARPDLLARKPEEKAWLMHMHRMSYRVMAKILVSHAYSLIRKDLGVGTTEIFHRNPLPLKPITQVDLEKVLLNYQNNHKLLLEKLNPLWDKMMTEKQKLEEAEIAHANAASPEETHITGAVLKEAKEFYYNAVNNYDSELKHPTIKFGEL